MRDDVDGVRKGRSRVTLVRARRGFPGGRARPVACEAARFGSTHCWVVSVELWLVFSTMGVILDLYLGESVNRCGTDFTPSDSILPRNGSGVRLRLHWSIFPHCSGLSLFILRVCLESPLLSRREVNVLIRHETS